MDKTQLSTVNVVAQGMLADQENAYCLVSTCLFEAYSCAKAKRGQRSHSSYQLISNDNLSTRYNFESSCYGIWMINIGSGAACRFSDVFVCTTRTMHLWKTWCGILGKICCMHRTNVYSAVTVHSAVSPIDCVGKIVVNNLIQMHFRTMHQFWCLFSAQANYVLLRLISFVVHQFITSRI